MAPGGPEALTIPFPHLPYQREVSQVVSQTCREFNSGVRRSGWCRRRHPPPFQPLAGTAFSNRCASIGKITPCDGHIHVAPTPFISRNLKGFEHPLDPPSPPPRSRRLLRSLLRRNKTDRLHGATPIEGEDTCRGVLASCRGNVTIYLSTVRKSNNNDAAVLLGKRLADNRGRFPCLLLVRTKVQNHRLILLLVHLLLKISL